MKSARLLAPLLSALLLLALSLPASAHHVASGRVPAGALPVPSITHGEMAVIARYRPAILALANSRSRSDDVTGRLLSFIGSQFAWCLWGIVPGSITDETSPFNECSHAYLAATSALLKYMRVLDDVGEAANALYDKVVYDTITSGGATVICGYSGEVFNTATVVLPDATMIPPPSPRVLALSGLSLAVLGAGVAVSRRRRT